MVRFTSSRICSYSFCYFSSFGLTEAITKDDLLKSRTAATKTLVIRSQDDLNLKTEIHQHSVTDDTDDDQSLDATDQTPSGSSDDSSDPNPGTSNQGTSADDTSSGTDQGESDDDTAQSSPETSAASDNQIEPPKQVELRDTTIGSLFDGSNSPFQITVYTYIDGTEIQELRLDFNDVKLISRE